MRLDTVGQSPVRLFRVASCRLPYQWTLNGSKQPVQWQKPASIVSYLPIKDVLAEADVIYDVGSGVSRDMRDLLSSEVCRIPILFTSNRQTILGES